jgi:GrpB-like predicted nucleotidyltransferase (UPF0157 family)/N-acetylglutamate synthase-like GNAT family acetyltransferase
MKTRSIEVAPYNPKWPIHFEEEAQRIKAALGSNCIDIHHIGSTSVPSLSAKPIIDIIPVVKSIRDVDRKNAEMLALGYEAKGEFGIPFRRLFSKGIDLRTHNVHIFEQNSLEIERHLKFRDWMRNHINDREAYAHLKINLAQQFPNDIMSYCLGKDEFIASIDEIAGYDGMRIVKALTIREWEAYHRIRDEQIFTPLNVKYDPNHPTITDTNHHHFVCIHGTKIVSVAHIEFLNNHEAALRSLATDEPFKCKGYGRHLMELLERWLTHHDRTVLKMHANLNAIIFYRKLGYTDIPNDQYWDDPCKSAEFSDMWKHF